MPETRRPIVGIYGLGRIEVMRSSTRGRNEAPFCMMSCEMKWLVSSDTRTFQQSSQQLMIMFTLTKPELSWTRLLLPGAGEITHLARGYATTFRWRLYSRLDACPVTFNPTCARRYSSRSYDPGEVYHRCHRYGRHQQHRMRYGVASSRKPLVVACPLTRDVIPQGSRWIFVLPLHGHWPG